MMSFYDNYNYKFLAMLSKIGVRTVDVGNAMLSMHSIRETAGSHDVQYAIDVSLAW